MPELQPTPAPAPEPTPTPTPSPAPELTPTPTPTPTPEPIADACPAGAAPSSIDVVHGPGEAAAADEVVAGLGAAGLTVGEVTVGEPTSSGIEYPDGQSAPAQWLAETLTAADLLRVSSVPRVTVVLGATGSAALVQAVAGLPACG